MAQLKEKTRVSEQIQSGLWHRPFALDKTHKLRLAALPNFCTSPQIASAVGWEY